jgi:hypothetical protein
MSSKTNDKIKTKTKNKIKKIDKTNYDIEINYDHYYCKTCDKKYKTNKNIVNHIQIFHETKVIYPIDELKSKIDKDKLECEKKTNKLYPSEFRIKQEDFIKNEFLSKEHQILLDKHPVYRKINPILQETLFGLTNELKQKILLHISNINPDINHSLLESFIKIFVIINNYKPNMNCLLLNECGNNFAIKMNRVFKVMKCEDLLNYKLEATKKVILNFIKLEKKILNKMIKKNILNIIISKINELNFIDYKSDTLLFKLYKFMWYYYLDNKYKDLQELYSAEIPLFYNYKLLNRTKFNNLQVFES